MMSSKPPRKLLKSIRGSPMRKDHMIKKSVRPSSPPLRNTGNSRPLPMKRLSSELKRGHIMTSTNKNLHSQRLITSSPHRSVARHNIQSSPNSVDRSRSFKRPKYEKRKAPSRSPIRHPSPLPISHDRRGSSPYRDERYLNSRQPVRENLLDPPLTKKKLRREPDRFSHSQSPNLLHKSTEIPFISDSGLSLRSEITSHVAAMPTMSRNYLSPPVHDERVERSFRSRHSPPPMSSNQSKRPSNSAKNSYNAGPGERYKNDGPSNIFQSSSEKSYAPTLNERFSSVETSRAEPRIRYSREDLEKITIDIRRNLREHSPTLRQIVNPSDVKLVRRAGEGHRPIFDREEIKQAPRDMREEAYYEKKMSGDGPYPTSHSMGLRDVENYEITRHRFDGHHAPFHSSSSRSLSDRWQNPDVRKESAALDRDDRESEYERMQPKKSFVEVRNRSKSGDRDFRSERYTGEIPKSRPEYHESHRRVVPTSSHPRGPVIHRKEAPSHPDIHRRLGMKRSGERGLSPPTRSESRSHFHPTSEKRYVESLISREKPTDRRSPGLEAHKYSQRSRGDIREDKMPEFSRRPDKYSYKSWPDKRDSSPPNSSYIPHGRDMPESYRGRGSFRSFRSSRGFRSRGFRGMSRGSFRSRGSFSGGYRGSNSPRGRGAPRRGRYSPHLWEHDMYSRLSPERK